MPPFGPVSEKELVRRLRAAGFAGPYPGTKHRTMEKGDVTVRVPNPHTGDISRDLLARILRQAGISREEWEQL